MAQAVRTPFKTFSLLPSTYVTSTTTSNAMSVLNDFNFNNMIVRVTATPAAASSGSITLDVFFQQSLDNGTTFIDVGHFTTISDPHGNADYLNISSSGDNKALGQVGGGHIASGLASATIGPALVSNTVRVLWILAGTSPSVTLKADLFYN